MSSVFKGAPEKMVLTNTLSLQGSDEASPLACLITNKHRGEFPGAYGRYYGGRWIKVNYPNKFDMAWGRSEGLITKQQEVTISTNWKKRAPTLEGTRLGGSIRFHGWIQEWANDGPQHLSWVRVVMHQHDIRV
jgi:hypothetical protein